jgi:hypothetical protein
LRPRSLSGFRFSRLRKTDFFTASGRRERELPRDRKVIASLWSMFFYEREQGRVDLFKNVKNVHLE